MKSLLCLTLLCVVAFAVGQDGVNENVRLEVIDPEPEKRNGDKHHSRTNGKDGDDVQIIAQALRREIGLQKFRGDLVLGTEEKLTRFHRRALKEKDEQHRKDEKREHYKNVEDGNQNDHDLHYKVNRREKPIQN